MQLDEYEYTIPSSVFVERDSDYNYCILRVDVAQDSTWVLGDPFL